MRVPLKNKARIVNAKPHKYPTKCERTEGLSCDKVIDITRYTFPDFEESDSYDVECLQKQTYCFYDDFIYQVLIFLDIFHSFSVNTIQNFFASYGGDVICACHTNMTECQ